jgi:hypothetical protein
MGINPPVAVIADKLKNWLGPSQSIIKAPFAKKAPANSRAKTEFNKQP